MKHLGLEGMTEIWNEYTTCERCPALCQGRSQVVIGAGSSSADVVIVGVSPTKEDDQEGIPFSGEAGRHLMTLLSHAWPESDEKMQAILAIKPDKQADDPHEHFFASLRDYLEEHILWTHAVACQIPEGRPPTPGELKNCRDRLTRMIYAADPLLVIALGEQPGSTLLKKKVSPGAKGGTIFDLVIDSPVTGNKIRYPMLLTYSPVFLLRQGDVALYPKRQGATYTTYLHLAEGLRLLNQEYRDLYDTDYPNKPVKHERE